MLDASRALRLTPVSFNRTVVRLVRLVLLFFLSRFRYFATWALFMLCALCSKVMNLKQYYTAGIILTMKSNSKYPKNRGCVYIYIYRLIEGDFILVSVLPRVVIVL